MAPVPHAPILIVEDNDDTREVLELMLQIRGYEVVSARDGLDAISYLQHGGQAAAIILDITMPVMDGIEVSRHLRTTPEWAHIPVIIYTSLLMKPLPNTVAVIRKGSDDPDRLLAVLGRVTQQRTH